MKEYLSKNQFLIISLMLFSMFFGAGNFIFPPMVGRDAGINLYEAIMFFCLTAVALPVLGVAAVAKSETLDNLVKRVDPVFGIIFTLLVYIVIGPAFAIPRAANMPFEVSIAPLVPENFNQISLFIYSIIYFLINYFICINPNKMVNTLGKFLTPVMLVLIFVLLAGAFISPMNDGAGFAQPIGKYATHPAASGFLDGYQTMDALASLVFAIVVINAMRALGIKNKKSLVSSTIKAGVLAGAILMVVYIALAYIGASSSVMFADAKNGANLLSGVTFHLFGNFGRLLLGSIFLLACLTTTVGLITSASEFFCKFNDKLGYKFWVITWSLLSFCVANIGLDAILKYSIPVLNAIYPVAIILIILALINNFLESSALIYRSCIYLAVIIGVVNALDSSGIAVPVLSDLFRKLPFYDEGLGFVIPEIACFALTYIIHIFRKKEGV